MTAPLFPYALTYMGNVLDVFGTRDEAIHAKRKLVDDVMADRLPNFLTADDFDDRADCVAAFAIVTGDYA